MTSTVPNGTTQIPAFRPRLASDPEPDLGAYRLVHRAMTRDLHRLATLVAHVAERTDDAWLDADRAWALARYANDLLAEVRRHHEGEGRLVWPMLRAMAGDDTDLHGVAEDHARVAPLIEEARSAVALLAASPYDVVTARHAARTTAELRDAVDAHVSDEEHDVFPVLRRDLTVEASTWLEGQIRRATPLSELAFVVPWMAAAADEDERRRSVAGSGLPFRMVLAATRGRHARRERAVFG